MDLHYVVTIWGWRGWGEEIFLIKDFSIFLYSIFRITLKSDYFEPTWRRPLGKRSLSKIFPYSISKIYIGVLTILNPHYVVTQFSNLKLLITLSTLKFDSSFLFFLTKHSSHFIFFKNKVLIVVIAYTKLVDYEKENEIYNCLFGEIGFLETNNAKPPF